MKLRHAVSLRLGLQGVKITGNVVKIGVHSYEKLVRSETSSFIFTRVGLEGVQISRTIAQVGMHVFISNGHPNL